MDPADMATAMEREERSVLAGMEGEKAGMKNTSPLQIIKGTKAIILYLRAFMDLHPDPIQAWRTIKRWERLYKLPLHTGLNGRPEIIPEEINEFFALTREGLSKGVTKGEFLTMLRKRQ